MTHHPDVDTCIEWVTEAKRTSTREKRVQQAVQWIAEGKPKEWEYMKEWRKRL